MFTPEFMDFLREYGLPLTMLVGLGISGYMGIWVWGRELKKSEKEAAEWKSIALESLKVSGRAVKKVTDDEQ